MQFYSQDGQDKFVALDIFKEKRGGVFLDVGAFDGVTLSNTNCLEKDLEWKGICVEPNPEVYQQLVKNRSCVCLNACIANEKQTVSFLSVSGWGVMLSGITAMLDKKHIDRIDKAIEMHGGSKKEIQIPALPLSDVLMENNIEVIDYCNVDVEGGELSVLKSIDFSRVNIKLFSVENNYNSREVNLFLRKKGYSLIGILGADEFYEKDSVRYGLMLKLKIKLLRQFINIKKQEIKKLLKKDKTN